MSEDLAHYAEAAARIAPYVRRTPLLTARVDGRKVSFKLENLQVAGVFKIRGALNALLARRRTRPLARHLRSASYGRRRSEVIKRQAAEDVAAIEQDDEYYRRAQHGEPTDDL